MNEKEHKQKPDVKSVLKSLKKDEEKKKGKPMIDLTSHRHVDLFRNEDGAKEDIV
jgi:hypothetical protein